MLTKHNTSANVTATAKKTGAFVDAEVGGLRLKNAVQQSTRYKGMTKIVYLYYSEKYNFDIGYSWVGVDRCASDLGINKRTVQRALRQLEADKRIAPYEKGNYGGGQWWDKDGRHGQTTRWIVVAPDAPDADSAWNDTPTA